MTKKDKFEKKLNKELHEEIVKIYKKIKKDVDKAVKGYKKAWNGNEKEVFAEVAFCILTPQSKAKNAWQAITNLVNNGLLFDGQSEEIAEYLNKAVFVGIQLYTHLNFNSGIFHLPHIVFIRGKSGRGRYGVV